uniref:HlyD family secretion protein n=1 Tax=Sphingomonas bacterium TaxID=1895847 RepID=UPI001576EDD2
MADADPARDLAAGQHAAPTVAAPVAAPRRWWRLALLVSVPVLIVALAAVLWLGGGRTVSTDNAYVRQDRVSVSSDVAGRIVAVAVRENQHVGAGDVLFRIDPDPYRIQVEQADAAIANAQVALTSLRADYRGTTGDIQAARDQIANTQESLDRQTQLMVQGFTTRAQLQSAQHAVSQARAQLANAVAGADKAQAKLADGAAVPGE